MRVPKTYSIEERVYESFDEITAKMNINKSSFIEDKIINFIKENKSILDNERERKNLTKWRPIMESMNLKVEYRKKLSFYAEHSMELANIRMTRVPSATLYIPMELKILSRLDCDKFDISTLPAAIIDGKARQAMDSRNKFSTTYQFPVPGVDMIHSYEQEIIEKSVEYFEKVLEKYDKIYFYCLISNILIEVNKEDNNLTDISIFHRFMLGDEKN